MDHSALIKILFWCSTLLHVAPFSPVSLPNILASELAQLNSCLIFNALALTFYFLKLITHSFHSAPMLAFSVQDVEEVLLVFLALVFVEVMSSDYLTHKCLSSIRGCLTHGDGCFSPSHSFYFHFCCFLRIFFAHHTPCILSIHWHLAAALGPSRSSYIAALLAPNLKPRTSQACAVWNQNLHQVLIF